MKVCNVLLFVIVVCLSCQVIALKKEVNLINFSIMATNQSMSDTTLLQTTYLSNIAIALQCLEKSVGLPLTDVFQYK